MKRTPARTIKSFTALMMVLCLFAGMIPMAFAAQSAGDKPASVTASQTKVYIRLSGAVDFFTGDKEGEGTIITPAGGTVCQLVSDDWYTVDGKDYYSVYYLSERYNVLKSSVEGDIMSAEELETYITGTLWKQTTFETLRKSMNLVGDVRVHALQLALQKLGYYPGALDGSYGKQTHDAVAKFQRAKGLDADGSAGPLTQPVLYNLAMGVEDNSGSSGSGSSSSTGNSGTLRTISSVNLRKKATKSSDRLAEVPKSVNLTYTDTYTPDGGVTWYQVTYAGQTGWVMGTYVTVTEGGSSSSGSTSTPTASKGTLRTIDSVNLRKKATKTSDRLAVVPKSLSLSFTDTYTTGGVTWYKVTYAGQTGWIMGTFVQVTSTTSTGSGSTTNTDPAIGKVIITMPSTRVRVSPNGDKSGYVLSKGSVVDLLATPVTAGGYGWYKIRTSSGLVGYVRDDCANASIGDNGGSGSSTVTSDKTFIKLPAATEIFTTETKPETGSVTVPANTVLMMVTAETYTKDGVEYCKLYYNNKEYHAVYAEVSSGVMSSSAVSTYMEGLLDTTLADALKREYDLVGDVYVYALQSALKRLNYYTGKLDGAFGAGTQSAVRNFQRAAKIDVDGSCGNVTWTALKAAIEELENPGSGSGSTGGSTTTTVAEFFSGATSVQKVEWDGDGVSLIPRGAYLSVLDVATGKVFEVYRWSGSKHADCVPATANDTKIMCDIVNFIYRDGKPTASHLANIIKYAKGEVPASENYAWPDFGGHIYDHDIGSAWDRRAALVRVNGSSKIYAVSIYGYPHGFEGDDSFSRATFPGNVLFYERNNYYGMMCLHFIGSKTHGGNAVDSQHQTNITNAYNWAKNNGYSSICK